MVRKTPGRKWTLEQQEKQSAALRAAWVRRKAAAESSGQPVGKRGVPLSVEHRQKISNSLRETAAKSPNVWAKTPEHREKIRQAKLAYEERFDEQDCMITPCEEKTRHWTSICNSHRRMKYRADTYGLSIQDLVDMYERQDGKCAICPRDIRLTGHKAVTDTEWIGVVDHHHETGEVRGLLCHPCNRALGMLLDSPDVLHRAIAYLQKADHVSS